MGVVNVTPDSFSDGGEWFDPAAAIAHGLDLLAEGADLVDVGRRVDPAGRAAARDRGGAAPGAAGDRGTGRGGGVVSIDTMRAAVAERAVAAGARLVNDVSGGRADPAMLPLVAGLGVSYVCMHWRGHSEDMQSRAEYDDVVADVVAELSRAGGGRTGGRDRAPTG